jgi:hypothetical protein
LAERRHTHAGSNVRTSHSSKNNWHAWQKINVLTSDFFIRPMSISIKIQCRQYISWLSYNVIPYTAIKHRITIHETTKWHNNERDNWQLTRAILWITIICLLDDCVPCELVYNNYYYVIIIYVQSALLDKFLITSHS